MKENNRKLRRSLANAEPSCVAVKWLDVTCSYRWVRTALMAPILILAFHPVALSLADSDADVKLAIRSPRRAFYRGEELAIHVRCMNDSRGAVLDAKLKVDVGGVIATSVSLGKVAAGKRRDEVVRISTQAIKSGPYELTVRLTDPSGTVASIREPFAIGRKPNPRRLMVWLWGGSGGAWYTKHGFTSWLGPSWRDAENGIPAAVRKELDDALLQGGEVSLSPNGGLRDLSDHQINDPDAQYIGYEKWFLDQVSQGKAKPIPNPFHPEIAKLQNEANRQLMELAEGYPQIKTAFFNSEVVDMVEINRNEAGIRKMEEMLGFSESDVGKPAWVAPGVISDEDKKYRLHKFAFKHGNGITEANRRTAEMVHKYRPDILTISDPFREAALLDLYPGLDVIETWTYTNPDPKLMLFVETVRAACKPTGQIPLNVVTMLNYPGELDTSDRWMLMGPGRVKVTSWINLSRAPKIIGYYYSSACVPSDDDSDQVPYTTSAAIQELSDKVFKPYGPMLTQLEVEPRRIAVLSSEASRTHGKSPRLLGHYNNMQIYHFFTVMAMAHLQADVVFDETLERDGLSDYDVLVLPKCDVLTESVYKAIAKFQSRGGIVIADQYLGAKIPGVIRFDFDFTYRDRISAKAIAENKAYAKWNDQLQPENAELKTVKGVTALQDQQLMESYAVKLKTALAGKVDPDVDCDSPTVLLNMLEKDGAKYLFVINDKRTYGERVGKYKAVLGKLLPQKTTIVLKHWKGSNLYAYDMLDRKQLEVNDRDGEFSFTVDLTELGGKIIALYPSRIESMAIELPKIIKVGVPSDIRIMLSNSSNHRPLGLQPIEVVITSPTGERNECSDYYCANKGELTINYVPAINDRTGRWRITALDLTSGIKAESEWELAK